LSNKFRVALNSIFILVFHCPEVCFYAYNYKYVVGMSLGESVKFDFMHTTISMLLECLWASQSSLFLCIQLKVCCWNVFGRVSQVCFLTSINDNACKL